MEKVFYPQKIKGRFFEIHCMFFNRRIYLALHSKKSVIGNIELTITDLRRIRKGSKLLGYSLSEHMLTYFLKQK